MNEQIENRIKGQSDILKVCDETLDQKTLDSFDAIREKGFEPFVVRGVSGTSRMNATIVFSHPNQRIEFPAEIDNTVVLFANNEDCVALQNTDRYDLDELCSLVPEVVNGLKVGQIDVIDFLGTKFYQRGLH